METERNNYMKQEVKWRLLVRLITVFFTAGCILFARTMAVAAPNEIKQKRIENIAALLPEKPAGFGSLITDRNAWRKLARNH